MRHINLGILVLLLFSTIRISAQWVPINGTYSQRILQEPIDRMFFDDSTFYAISNNTPYKCNNDSLKWKRIKLPENSYSAELFFVNGSNYFAGIQGKGIFLSTNYGGSWSHADSGITNTDFKNYLIHDGYLFIGTNNNGLYRTSNNGNSWEPVNIGLTNIYITAMVAGDSNVFIGTAGSGVFISSNNGIKWKNVSAGLGNTNIIFLFYSDSYLYAGTTGGVFFSSDKGSSWKSINSGNEQIRSFIKCDTYLLALGYHNAYRSSDNGINWTVVYSYPQDYGSISFLASKSEKLYMGLDNSNLYTSTDFGMTWELLNKYSYLTNVNAISVSNGVIIVGGNKIYRSSDNGNTWKLYDFGVAGNGGVNSFLEIDSSLYAGFAQSNYGIAITTDRGEKWSYLTSTYMQDVNTLAKNKNNLYLGSTTILCSTDKGLSWKNVSGDLFGQDDVSALLYIDDTLFAGNNSGVFVTSDNGATWQERDSLLESWQKGTTFLTYINNFLFRGGSKYGGGMLKSTNLGKTWIPCNDGLTTTVIFSVYSYGKNLIASTENGVFISTDLGEKWHSKNEGFPTNPYYRFSAGPFLVVDDYMLAGTYVGLFKRPLSELIWNESLPDIPVLTTPADMAINQPVTLTFDWNDAANSETYGIQISTDSLFANIIQADSGLTISQKEITSPLNKNTKYYWRVNANNTSGKSNWSAAYSLTTVSDIPAPVKTLEFKLKQNYPNPFNPSTYIDFSVPRKLFVNIRIYNLMGEMVSKLVAREFNEGEHTIEWNGSGFTSGVYFYKISAGEFSETKKLMLIR